MRLSLKILMKWVFIGLIISTFSTACYNNEEYQRRKKEKEATPDEGTTQATIQMCSETPKPPRCTASPDEPGAFSDATSMHFMIFDNEGSLAKATNPTSAYSDYFNKLKTEDYALVFEIVGYDIESDKAKQDIYLNIWPGGEINKLTDEIKIKKHAVATGTFSKYRYKATLEKKKYGYDLETMPQTIVLPISSSDQNAPPMVWKEAEIVALIQFYPEGKKFSFQGSITGKLTKESYQKSIIHRIDECPPSCVVKASATACTPGKAVDSCSIQCTSTLQYCLSGDTILNSGFTFTVDGKPYSAATAKLIMRGVGVTITGAED